LKTVITLSATQNVFARTPEHLVIPASAAQYVIASAAK
jgi:hypothetical protein